MFRALSRKMKFLKRPTNALECVDISLLCGNCSHVSATHLAIFRVARAKIQPQLYYVGINPKIKK